MSFTQSPSATFAPPPIAAPPLPLDIRSLSFPRWKELTSVTLQRRGDNLRKLDVAVEEYLANKQSVDAMDRMRKAFRDWAAHKYQQRGKTLVYPIDFTKPIKDQLWSDEPRNARGAMTALFNLLFTPALLSFEMGRSPLSPEENAAIAWWQGEIDKRAYEIFKGQRLEFRLLTPGAPNVRISEAGDYPAQRMAGQLAALPANSRPTPAGLRAVPGAALGYAKVAGSEVYGLVDNAYSLGSGIAELAAGIELSIQQMAGVADPHVATTILQAMGLPAAADIAGRMVPFFGGATTLIKGGVALGQAIMAHRAATRVRARADRFRDGAARQAVIGIGELLDDEARSKAKSGGVQVISGSTAIGLVFVDGGAVSGPAVGMAQLLAELLLLAAEYVEDYKHRNAVNAYLETIGTSGTLHVGVELFERSPLLGAYYLMIAETSTVIALSLDRLNQPGVMQEIEGIVRADLPEVLEKASALIEASHLMVPGLLSHRLHYNKTTTTRAKEVATSAGTMVKGFFARLASVACYRKNLGINPPSDPRYVGISSTEYFATHPPATGP